MAWRNKIRLILSMTLPFYLGISMMKVKAEPEQRFRGKQNTIKQLLSMNSASYPYEIVQDENFDLVLRYKLADAKWKGILFRGGLKKTYTLYLKLDEANKIAYCVEKTKSVNWDQSLGLGRLNAKVGGGFFVGIVFLDTRKIVIYDALQGFKNLADIKYNVGDVKWPVFNMLLKCGWIIKPRLFTFQVKK